MLREPDLFSRTQIWEPLPAENTPVTPQPKPRLWPLQTLLCTLLCAAVLVCKALSPAATQVLEDLIIGTGESRLRSAAACFTAELDGGGSVGSAISVFCDEIITP